MAAGWGVSWSVNDSNMGSLTGQTTISGNIGHGFYEVSDNTIHVYANFGMTDFTVTATANTGYAFSHWTIDGTQVSSGDTSQFEGDPSYVVAVFVEAVTTTNISLTNGHNYIVACATSGGISSITLSGTTLTVVHLAPFDTIDLGAGTGGDAPKVTITLPSGVYGLNNFES